MGIVKEEDLIGWRDGNKITCTDCGDPGNAKPLTKDDFEDGDIVICDECDEEIYWER